MQALTLSSSKWLVQRNYSSSRLAPRFPTVQSVAKAFLVNYKLNLGMLVLPDGRTVLLRLKFGGTFIFASTNATAPLYHANELSLIESPFTSANSQWPETKMSRCGTMLTLHMLKTDVWH